MGKIADIWEGNNVTNWAAAAKELDMVTLRTQYGANKADKMYADHVTGCKVNNIPFGSYAYARFVNVADAEVEAKTFLSRIDKATKYLCVDVEEVTTKNPADLVPATQRFIDVCRKAGYKVGMYTGHAFYFDNHMDKVDCDFLWIPRYPGNDTGQPTGLKPAMACDIWQYTENGTLSGVSGAVDLNMLVGHTTLDVFKGVAANPPYSVVIPNVAHWQAQALVAQYEKRGFSCEGIALKTYGPNQKPDNNDPYEFIIYTFLNEAKPLVIELQDNGYPRAYGIAR